MNLKFKKFSLKIVKNERALYSFLELKDHVDFTVKRIYFIQNCSSPTGQHCHKVEEELFVMAKGSCVAVIDKGDGIEEIKLEAPGDAIYVGNYVWHGFKEISPDAILLAASSTNYKEDRSDYIEDYGEYARTLKSKV